MVEIELEKRGHQVTLDTMPFVSFLAKKFP